MANNTDPRQQALAEAAAREAYRQADEYAAQGTGREVPDPRRDEEKLQPFPGRRP